MNNGTIMKIKRDNAENGSIYMSENALLDSCKNNGKYDEESEINLINGTCAPLEMPGITDDKFVDDILFTTDHGYDSDVDIPFIPGVHSASNSHEMSIGLRVHNGCSNSINSSGSITSCSDRGSSISTLENEFENYLERVSVDFNLGLNLSPIDNPLEKMKEHAAFHDILISNSTRNFVERGKDIDITKTDCGGGGFPQKLPITGKNNCDISKGTNEGNNERKTGQSLPFKNSKMAYLPLNDKNHVCVPGHAKNNTSTPGHGHSGAKDEVNIKSDMTCKPADNKTKQNLNENGDNFAIDNKDGKQPNDQSKKMNVNNLNWYDSPFYSKDLTKNSAPSATKRLKQNQLPEIKLLLKQASLEKYDGSKTSTNGKEEDEFEFNPTHRRRCKSLKTIKTPPGTPHPMKKMVRFADAMGLDLEQVKHVMNLEDPPHIPESAKQDLEIEPEELFPTQNHQRQQQHQHSGQGTTYLRVCFPQPGASPNFIQCVQDRNVMLENCEVDGQERTMTGTIRVKNIAFHKRVVVRHSIDNWRTFTDVEASYVPGSHDGSLDRFAFTVRVPSYFQIGDKLEVAVKYAVDGREYWDNNGGRNYMIQCLPMVEKDTNCMWGLCNFW